MTRMSIQSWWELTKTGLKQSIEVQAYAVEKACVHSKQVHEPFTHRVTLLKGIWDVAGEHFSNVRIQKETEVSFDSAFNPCSLFVSPTFEEGISKECRHA